MKKSTIAVILAALILCITPVVVSEYAKYQPITIKTELTDGEVVSHVRLSDGELWFKTDNEVLQQTVQDYDELKATTESLREINQCILHGWDRSLKGISREDMESLMNVTPGLWQIPEHFDENSVLFVMPNVYANSERTRFAVADIILHYTYIVDASARININVGVGGTLAGIPQEGPDFGTPPGYANIDALHLEFAHHGKRDSRIGDTPMALVLRGDSYMARFTIANADYSVSATGVTQREFIKLLISICEAPRENTQDVVEYILEHG